MHALRRRQRELFRRGSGWRCRTRIGVGFAGQATGIAIVRGVGGSVRGGTAMRASARGARGARGAGDIAVSAAAVPSGGTLPLPLPLSALFAVAAEGAVGLINRGL